jgi:predicted lipoprotein with Yx(FWY)xxD motif
MGVRVWALLGSLLLGTGCSADSEPESSRSTESSETTRATPTRTDARTASVEPTRRTSSAAVDGTTIVVDESEYGPMLYDGTGQAIYMFDVETTADPRCYDDCAVAWPPVLTEGEPVAADGADRALLGTTERADGRLQVTYNDHPLYFYAHEGKHEVLCHDVFLNGGNWYVVQPGGDPAPPA